MKAIVIEKPNVASLKDIPYPNPAANEVTIKVKNAGICGTDINIYKGTYNTKYPIIPGHEFSGVIDKVGKNVKGFVVGDKVGIDPSYSCGECKYCRLGKNNLCDDFGGIGTTKQGCMAEYVVSPVHKLYKLTNEISFSEAALIEPFACVIHAINRINIKPGNNVLLFGVGSMGIQLIQALKINGASEIVAVDILENKLELALKYGATEVSLSDEVNDKFHNKKFDIVIDVTGVSSVIENSFNYLDKGGVFLQFGVAASEEEVSLNPFEIFNKEWTIMGSMSLNTNYGAAYELIKNKRVKIKDVVSDFIKIEEAITYFKSPENFGVFKTQIKFD